jgi:hypothetical protein
MVMQPNQAPPAPPPMQPGSQGRNPYEFITGGSPAPASRPKLGLPGNSIIKRLIIVMAGILVLIIVVAIFTSVLSSGEKNNKANLLKAVNEQALIIHIADVGVTKAKSPDAKNLAITTRATMTSQQADLVAAIKARNINIAKTSLTITKDTATDNALTTAEQANQFDEAFIKLLAADINTYLSTLNDAYKGSASKTLKTVLHSQYDNTALLINAEPKT